MLRITADRIEGIVCAATEAKDEGSTVAEVLEELAPLLRKARCDDREKVLRRITNLFGVSGVARTAAFVMFGLSPREKAPSKKAPRKSGSSISDAARARLAELAARPRRACAYGAGTRGSPLGKSR